MLSVIIMTCDPSYLSSALTCGPESTLITQNHFVAHDIRIRNKIYHKHVGLCKSIFNKPQLILSCSVCVLLCSSGMADQPSILWVRLWAVWQGTGCCHPETSERGRRRGHGADCTHPLQSGQVSDDISWHKCPTVRDLLKQSLPALCLCEDLRWFFHIFSPKGSSNSMMVSLLWRTSASRPSSIVWMPWSCLQRQSHRMLSETVPHPSVKTMMTSLGCPPWKSLVRFFLYL